MADINYAKEYSEALAQMFPYVLNFGRLYSTPNNGRYRIGEHGKTVEIPVLDVTGRSDANRDTIASPSRNYDNGWETKVLSNHRKWKTLVHPRNIDQTNEVVSISNITNTFNNEQKFPEMDAYTISKIYADWIGQKFAPDIVTLSTANVLDTFDKMMQRASEKRVPFAGRVLYITPAVDRLLKNASGVNRNFDAQSGAADLNRIIRSMDQVEIQVVPPELMMTAYSFTTGWEPAAMAKQIDMMLVHPLAVITPVSYQFSKLDAPAAGSDGKYVYYEESDEDVFILNRKANAIQFAMADAGAAGALTVTSAANTAADKANGDTVISVAGEEASGTKLVRKIASAAIAAPKLGEEVSGYEELTDGGVIAGQTASHYIRVVELNADGKVIKTGTCQLTVTSGV